MTDLLPYALHAAAGLLALPPAETTVTNSPPTRRKRKR